MRRAFAAQAGAATGDNQGTHAGAASPEAGQRVRVEEGAAPGAAAATAAAAAAGGGGALRLRVRGWAGLAPGTPAGDGDAPAAVRVEAEPTRGAQARALAPSQEQT